MIILHTVLTALAQKGLTSRGKQGVTRVPNKFMSAAFTYRSLGFFSLKSVFEEVLCDIRVPCYAAINYYNYLGLFYLILARNSFLYFLWFELLLGAHGEKKPCRVGGASELVGSSPSSLHLQV